MKIQIDHGRVLNPIDGYDAGASLYIDGETICGIGTSPTDWQAAQVIDATSCYVFPGLVDISTRLRQPGQEHKATVASETYAAAASGITSLACLPDTDPPIDSPAEVELVQQLALDAGHCRVHVIGALTAGLNGNTLSEMAALKHAGCVGVSNAHQPMENMLVMRRAMEYASSQDLTVFLQPMDFSLASNGCIHEGITATRQGLGGIPSAAETSAVGQLLALIDQTQVRSHFCQLSTQRSLQMIERARFDGAPVSADVCAHQLFLSEHDIENYDANYHVLPPLRTHGDLQGLRTRLANGTIVAICSDHQPHEPDAKLAPFAATEPGISSVETLLPLVFKLVQEEVLSLQEALGLVTYQPAQVLGINAGSIRIGGPADLCIFDPTVNWTLEAGTMFSAGKNTPFLGHTFDGKVTHTFLGGRLVYKR